MTSGGRSSAGLLEFRANDGGVGAGQVAFEFVGLSGGSAQPDETGVESFEVLVFECQIEQRFSVADSGTAADAEDDGTDRGPGQQPPCGDLTRPTL